jgi:4-amino-4-deoxy-L-arabinose transferase-like glycosyltransferase
VNTETAAAPGATATLESSQPRTAVPAVVTCALIMFGLHIVAVLITPYSVHRDELLYLAMGRYLDLFAMDFPPFIAIAANAMRGIFGDSLFAIRVLPAVAGAVIVVLTAQLTRELGGDRSAQVLAMVSVLSAPLFMRAAALFQPVVFDQVWWTLALLALLRIGARGRPRDWLLLGVAGGLGLLTKFSIGFIAIGILAGLVLTAQRRWLATRWPHIAGAVALLIGSPSIIGQITLGMPAAGQMADLQAAQLSVVTPLSFLSGQLMMIGPVVAMAALGLWWLMRNERARAFRAAGIACAVAFLALLALQGKPYYAGPIYPLLLAAGAVAITTMRRHAPAWTATAAAAALIYGSVALPLGLPVLPPAQMAGYAAALGMTSATTTNRGTVLPLPQDYADMLGWEEQVAAVATAYDALPAADRERAIIIAANYGEAGAIDYFGPALGLPRAIAPVGSYWFFGPGDLPGDVAVTLGLEAEDLEGFYAEFVVVRRIANEWGVPEQQDNPIGVARRPFRSVQEVWPELAGRN